MDASLQTQVRQRLLNLDESETDIRSLASLFESLPGYARDSARLWRQAMTKVEKNKKLFLFYAVHQLITQTRGKSQLFIQAFGDEILPAAELFCQSAYDIKKLESFNKLADIWLQLKIYTDSFIAQLHSLVSARKSQLRDNLNRLDTGLLDLIDDMKKTESKALFEAILVKDATVAVKNILKEKEINKENLVKENDMLSERAKDTIKALHLLGEELEAAVLEFEAIDKDKLDVESMKQRLQDVENQTSFF